MQAANQEGIGHVRWIGAAVLVAGCILGTTLGYHRAASPALDLIAQLWPRTIEALPVAIVTIDEASLSTYGQWPWPRSLTARLVDAIKAQDPVAIGLDIIMPEPDRLSPKVVLADHVQNYPNLGMALDALPSNDEVLGRALGAGPVPVVLGNAGLSPRLAGAKAAPEGTSITALTPFRLLGDPDLRDVPAYTRVLRNVPVLSAAGTGHGLLNAAPDADGTIRRIPLLGRAGDTVLPSVAVELLRTAQGSATFAVHGSKIGVTAVEVGELVVPTAPDSSISVRFSGHDQRRFISARDVLEGDASGTLGQKIVLLGVTALGLTDAPPTPVAARMDGVEIQAQLLENLLANDTLHRPEFALALEVVLALVLGGCIVWLVPRWGIGAGAGITLIALTVAFGGATWGLTQRGLLLDPAPPQAYLVLTFGCLAAGMFALSERARRALRQALEDERVARARLDGELNAAREIQRGILPKAEDIELPPGCSLHAYLESAAEVGGDLYDITYLEDGRLFLVLGDVSGKGVPASLFMAVSKTLCKSTALRGSASAADILTQANREIARENPTLLFVTAVVALVDLDSGDLDIAVAGHDAPLIARSGATPRRLAPASGPPLCVLDDFDYESEVVRLAAGETLVLTTDGVSDAMNPQGEFFGTEGLNRALCDLPPEADAQQISARITAAIASFRQDASPSDDIAVLSFQFGHAR